MAARKKTVDQKALRLPSEKELANEVPQTLGYDPFPLGFALYNAGKRPIFSLIQADLMLLDHQVWLGLVVGNAPLLSAEVEVEGPDDEVNKFVGQQWDRLWTTCAPKILQSKHYGYSGYEVMYDEVDGRLEFDTLRDLHPRDTTVLRTMGGQFAGMAVRGIRHHDQQRTHRGQVNVLGSKCLWVAYNALHGSRYGRALLQHAYAPWYEKAMDGGHYDLRRLRMLKDAWIGDVMYYLLGMKFTGPEGQEISARDLAREAGEMRMSGGVMALPMRYSKDGKQEKILEYTPPTQVTGATPIQESIDSIDWDIMDGLLVPREVIEASETGSGFSGRSIPFLAFLNIRDAEFGEDVRQVNEQTIHPLVCINYGRARADSYKLKPKPLVETFGKQMKGLGQGQGQSPQPNQPPAQVGQQPGAGAGFPWQRGGQQGGANGRPGGQPMQFSDPAFESKHPRGQPDNAGQFAKLPASVKAKMPYKSGQVRRAMAQAPTGVARGWSEVTDEERQAFVAYADEEAYVQLNADLRAGRQPDVKHTKLALAMERAIQRAGQFPEPVACWRGVFLPPEEQQELLAKIRSHVGKHVRMRSFVSTTLNPRLALAFAESWGVKGVVFEIKAKTGMYLSGQVARPHEQEILQNRGTRYRVKSVSTETIGEEPSEVTVVALEEMAGAGPKRRSAGELQLAVSDDEAPGSIDPEEDVSERFALSDVDELVFEDDEPDDDEPLQLSDPDFEAKHKRGQPDNTGQFARKPEKGKKATAFVSPNTEEGLTFEKAAELLSAQQQRDFRALAEDVHNQLGIQSEIRDVVGDWSDGAEPSTAAQCTNVADVDELRYLLAWQGKLVRQKAVLGFIRNRSGKDFLWTFDVPDDIKEVRSRLSALGIQFRTLKPDEGRVRVMIVDEGGQLAEKVKEVARHYGIRPQRDRGTQVYVGASGQDEAQRAYDGVIADYERRFLVRRRYRPASGRLGDDPRGGASSTGPVEQFAIVEDEADTSRAATRRIHSATATAAAGLSAEIRRRLDQLLKKN